MGGDEPAAKKRKADSTPPEGYVCRLCSIPGHWIQVCPTKKTGSKKRKSSNHTPVPGKDPSEDDIERARELQKIPPPKCFCGLPSRLNKVKRSKEGGDSSRAIGKYFFFCSKKRDDESQCRFARPIEMELKKQKGGGGDKAKGKSDAARGKQGRVEKKAEKSAKGEIVCKFFAKSGKCKKGLKCEFSHDVQSKKAPEKAADAPKASKSRSAEDNEKDDKDGGSSAASSSCDESSDGDASDQKKKDKGEGEGSSSSDESSSDSSSDDGSD